MFFQMSEYDFEKDKSSTLALLAFILGLFIQVTIIPALSETPACPTILKTSLQSSVSM